MRPGIYKVAFLLLLTAIFAGCNWKRKATHFDDNLNAQHQFFYRLQQKDLYAPDPKVEDLELDENDYHEWKHLQEKLDELHLDINTVLVKPDPKPIRFLAVQEDKPEALFHLFLLTGDDSAQLLEDGIHLRRRSLPERILGGHVKRDDQRLHSEMSTVLWQRDNKNRWIVHEDGWAINDAGAGWVARVSWTIIRGEIKKHKIVKPAYGLDCKALARFVRPLQSGEPFRELTLKVNVPMSDAQTVRAMGYWYPCWVDLSRRPALIVLK